MLECGTIPRSSQAGLQKFVQQAIALGLAILADFKVEAPEVVAGAVMNVLISVEVDEVADVAPAFAGLGEVNGASGEPVFGGEPLLIREDGQTLAELVHGLAKVFVTFIFSFGHPHDVMAGKLGQFKARADHPGLGVHRIGSAIKGQVHKQG